MKFSIITPCYNAAEYIEETIESVFSQRGDFEIQYIVVDGASSDNTVLKLKYYKQEIEYATFPIRCRGVSFDYLSEPDNGMYDALAKGLNLADGDIVAYINADDYYLPNAFSAVAAAMATFKHVKWVTGINTWFNKHGHIVHSNLPPGYRADFIRKGIHGHGLPHIQQESTFWRRDLLDNLDYERLASYRLAGDYYLWHQFAQSSELQVLKAQLAGFRVRENQQSSDKEFYEKEFFDIASDKPGFRDRIKGKLYNAVWRSSHSIKVKFFKEGSIGLHSPRLENFHLNTLDQLNGESAFGEDAHYEKMRGVLSLDVIKKFYSRELMEEGGAERVYEELVGIVSEGFVRDKVLKGSFDSTGTEHIVLPKEQQRRFLSQRRWLFQGLRSQALRSVMGANKASSTDACGGGTSFVLDEKTVAKALGEPYGQVKTCYRLPPNKVVKGEFRGNQEIVSEGDTVVLIYQMGKVGSSAVFSALQKARLTIPKYQIHFLNPERLDELSEWYQDREVEFEPGHATISRVMTEFVSQHKESVNWKIISLMRDPIAFQVSSIFENIEGHSGDLHVDSEKFDPDAYLNKIKDNLKGSAQRSHHFLNWFQEELGEQFGVNVFEHPAVFDKGYTIIQQGNIEVLLLKFEALEEAFTPAVEQFFGLQGVELERANVGEDKVMGSQYKEFVKTLGLPKDLCDEIYAAEVVKYFYSDEEIEGFKRRWSGDFS